MAETVRAEASWINPGSRGRFSILNPTYIVHQSVTGVYPTYSVG